MRHLAIPLLATLAAAVAGCAMHPAAPAPAPAPSAAAAAAMASVCELATVPSGAVFGVRHGVDTATYPATMPRAGTGCQRVWYGERAHPERMQVMATYYYDGGHVRRLAGRVPGGASYDCHYRDGTLDTARSQNPGQCPKASELQ